MLSKEYQRKMHMYTCQEQLNSIKNIIYVQILSHFGNHYTIILEILHFQQNNNNRILQFSCRTYQQEGTSKLLINP